jgi:hypothetical protein
MVISFEVVDPPPWPRGRTPQKIAAETLPARFYITMINRRSGSCGHPKLAMGIFIGRKAHADFLSPGMSQSEFDHRAVAVHALEEREHDV